MNDYETVMYCRQRVDDAKADLQYIATHTESECQEYFNTDDTLTELNEFFCEELENCEQDLAEAEAAYNAEQIGLYVDPAFDNYNDFYNL